MSKALVSIITINYNQAAVTCALLASLRQLTYPHYEVLVVDNASPTDDPAPIAVQFPEVRLLRSTENLGFAGGNNLGIREARGEYCLLINNDTEVQPNLLEALLGAFAGRPRLGIATPKLVFWNTPGDLLQYAGSNGLSSWTLRGTTVGYLEPDRGQHDASGATPLIHGAAMLVPTAVIRAAGLLPAIYFLYYEELDWCEMIKRAGYEAWYEASTTVYHKESVSVGQGSVLRTYYLHRNRLLFIRRNLRGWRRWSSGLFFLMVATPKSALLFALRRQWGHLRALGRGLRWHLGARDIYFNERL